MQKLEKAHLICYKAEKYQQLAKQVQGFQQKTAIFAPEYESNLKDKKLQE